jgi:hypothetical protein
MASYGFHSEAADEYLTATRYYLDHASPLVAAAFVAEIKLLFKLCSHLRQRGQYSMRLKSVVICSSDSRTHFIIVGNPNEIEFPSMP